MCQSLPLLPSFKVFYRTCHSAMCIVMQHRWWHTCNETHMLSLHCQMQMFFQKLNVVFCFHSLAVLRPYGAGWHYWYYEQYSASLWLCWVPGEVFTDVMSLDGTICLIASLFPKVHVCVSSRPTVWHGNALLSLWYLWRLRLALACLYQFCAWVRWCGTHHNAIFRTPVVSLMMWWTLKSLIPPFIASWHLIQDLSTSSTNYSSWTFFSRMVDHPPCWLSSVVYWLWQMTLMHNVTLI